MQASIRIHEIRARAQKLRLSIPTLCRLKRVPSSTVYRWINGETDARRGAYEAVCALLEEALAEEEAKLRRLISRRRRRAA